MAKKSMIARDKKRQGMITKYAAKRAELKAAGDQEGLQALPRNAAQPVGKIVVPKPADHALTCVRFGLSRIKFREKASKGEIPGVTKASW